MTASQPYEYQSLDQAKQEFRWLRLRGGSFEQPIRCSIVNASLAEDPWPYETVSYCWGTSHLRAAIDIDNVTTMAPRSSVQALRHIRLPNHERLVWIDAICINQLDVEERKQQVQLMGDIYRKSTGNLIFLGEDDGTVGKAIESLRAILSDMETTTQDHEHLNQVLYDQGGYVWSLEGFSSQPDWDALVRLYSRSWFGRLWVLQEAALATRNEVICGTFHFALADVLRAAMWIEHKYRFVPDGLIRLSGRRNATTMGGLVDKDLGLTTGYEQGLPMSYLLNLARRFECTEARDSVFATLGLSGAFNLPSLLSTDHLLEPNYMKPLWRVLCDATRYAMQERNDLSILEYVHHRSSYITSNGSTIPPEQVIPSWALRAYCQVSNSEDVNELPTFFEACQNLDSATTLQRPSPGPRILELEGYVLDHVSASTQVCHADAWSDTDSCRLWLQNVRSIAAEAASLYRPDITTLWHNVAFTLCAGQDREGRKASEEYALHCLGLLDSLDKLEGMPIEFFYCSNRRFFVGTRGYMGLGPMTMQPGDVVAVVRGGNVPFILRQHGEHFCFVGACYAHAIMYGEVPTAEGERIPIVERIFHVE